MLNLDPSESNINILLRVDNTTAIAYVNKIGGIQHSKFLNLSSEIRHWVEEKNTFLLASYIKSSENIETDHLSRELTPIQSGLCPTRRLVKLLCSLGTQNWTSSRLDKVKNVKVLKTLRKIDEDGAMGIVVVPDWPSQLRYSLLFKMLVSEPVQTSPEVHRPSKNLPSYIQK
ncbi:hypothetical protein TKK_0019269 [Trichogramma kaykai]